MRTLHRVNQVLKGYFLQPNTTLLYPILTLLNLSLIHISQSQKEKIALFCDVDIDAVIEAQDRTVLYEIPNIFARQKIDDYICRHLDLKTAPLDLSRWNEMVAKIKNLRGEVKIGLVGEYVSLKDAYIDVYKRQVYNVNIPERPRGILITRQGLSLIHI